MVASFQMRASSYAAAASGELNGSESDGTQLLAGGIDFLPSGNWPGDGAAMAPNDALSPGGSIDAIAMVGDGGDNRHILYQRVNVNTAYTFSVYAKEGSLRYLQMVASDTSTAFCYIDLQTGTVTDSGVSGTVVISSVDVETGANGFYKITMNLTDSSSSNTYFQYCLSDRSTNTAPLTFGSPKFVTTGHVYLWRPKVTSN